jgi:hypothetical protein
MNRPQCGFLTTLVGVVAVTLATSSLKADIIHSDVMGASVWFTAISEGSPTGDPLPLYNQPFASGDELVFSPTANFSAVSTSGGPANQTDGKLYFTVEAKPGATIQSLGFEEVGLVVLNAPFGGDAFTSVLAFAEIKILEVNNVPIVSAPTSQFFNFAPDSSFLHSADATGPSFSTPWTGNLVITFPNDVTKALIALDNHLYAATVGVGTGALIEKKGLSVNISTVGSPIPEPSTLALFAIGCAAIGCRRRPEAILKVPAPAIRFAQRTMETLDR